MSKHTDEDFFSFGASRENIKDGAAINFLQDGLHDLIYSYINGGFSKKGFVFYPLIKDLSNENREKIINLMMIAEFLNKRGFDFSDTLGLFRKGRLSGKNAHLFISHLYRDFSKTKKPKTEIKKIGCEKFGFDGYIEEDLEYLEPVRELNKFAESKLREYLVDMHIHGSIATRDYIKGWSDLDTLVIIRKNVLDKPEMLVKLRNLLYMSKKYFYKIDPLQHHGHLVITEHDLDYYCQTFFPTELFKYSKSVFGVGLLNTKIRNSKIENINRLYRFVNYFRNVNSNKNFNMGSYDLKHFFHMVTLFPTMYLQAKGIHVYKKFSFNIAKKDFGKSEWEVIDDVTSIRSGWKGFGAVPLVGLGARINPLLFYRLSSMLADLLRDIKKEKSIDVSGMAKRMHKLSEKAWNNVEKNVKSERL